MDEIIQTNELGQDFSRKMVVVLNKGIDQWKALNGLAHVSAYLGNRMQAKFDTEGSFMTKDGVAYPKNSQYSLIALQANPGQMPNLMQKVRNSGLLYHAFIADMLENDDIEVQKIMGNRTDAETEFFAIGIFGTNEEVAALTKNYSLWK